LLFAARLKAAREAAGYSQRGLGIALGFDPSAASPRINQYEGWPLAGGNSDNSL
jgi:transcriptional regulator with XRE-family HTH domain